MKLQPFLRQLGQAVTFSALPLTIVGLATGLPKPAIAASFSVSSIDQLYVFGDSLVDDGNLYNTVGKLINYPPTPPYFQGRFSNGPVWAEDLAPKLGLTPNPATNFAFGGSSTGLTNAVLPTAPVPGLLAQVLGFVAATPTLDSNGLYILSGGSNDYFFGTATAPISADGKQGPLVNLAQAVSLLVKGGAKNILVSNVPDLGKLPISLNTPRSASLSSLSAQHNAGLAQELSALDQQFAPDVNVLLLDQAELFDRALTNPSAFGFTNVTEPCLGSTTVCSNPDNYLFWDQFHPTAAGHQAIADFAFSTLQTAAAVPEPTSTLGVITFGAIAVGMRRRQSVAKPTAKVKAAKK